MKQIFSSFLILVTCIQLTYAQKKLPVLRTNKTTLDVKEGSSLYRDIWQVSSETKPDVFVTNKFEGNQRVTFYSDNDSISFLVKPNNKYDFIVLINGKDSAFTQIDTYGGKEPSLKLKLFYTKLNKEDTKPDTIPFQLGNDNRIHLKGKLNDSDSLDFIFDTGASSVVVKSSIVNNKVKVRFDGSNINIGTDGSARVESSSKNKIEIGKLIWKNVPLISINYVDSNFKFDAVFPWVAFEDKVVEINYENKYMVIHDSLSNIPNDYSKSKIKLIHGIPYIKCILAVNGREIEGWFDFDTGSNGSLIVSQQFASAHGLNNSMKLIGGSYTKGSTGIAIKNARVLLPKLKLGAYEIYQIPLTIPQQDPLGTSDSENIGNNILKRFNVIIDFKNNFIYLKPNNLLYTPLL